MTTNCTICSGSGHVARSHGVEGIFVCWSCHGTGSLDSGTVARSLSTWCDSAVALRLVAYSFAVFLLDQLLIPIERSTIVWLTLAGLVLHYEANR